MEIVNHAHQNQIVMFVHQQMINVHNVKMDIIQKIMVVYLVIQMDVKIVNQLMENVQVVMLEIIY